MPKMQVDLASKLEGPSPYISKYESGERRLDVVEFLEVVGEIDCAATEILAALLAANTKARRSVDGSLNGQSGREQSALDRFRG